MGELFSKFSKAVDAFTDVLTGDVSSIKTVALYKYSNLTAFVTEVKKENPSVSICRVSMTKQKEFGEVVFPETKYVVRVLLLDKNRQPIRFEGNDDAYLGTVVIASSVDTKMNEFMQGKTERAVAVRGE